MIEFKPEDLHVSLYTPSSRGNWNTSDHDTGVTIVHLPTGTKVSVERTKSQHKNKHEAISILQDLSTPFSIGDEIYTVWGKVTINAVDGGGIYHAGALNFFVLDSQIAHTELGYNYKNCLNIKRQINEKEQEFLEYRDKCLKRIQELGGY